MTTSALMTVMMLLLIDVRGEDDDGVEVVNVCGCVRLRALILVLRVSSPRWFVICIVSGGRMVELMMVVVDVVMLVLTVMFVLCVVRVCVMCVRVGVDAVEVVHM